MATFPGPLPGLFWAVAGSDLCALTEEFVVFWGEGVGGGGAIAWWNRRQISGAVFEGLFYRLRGGPAFWDLRVTGLAYTTGSVDFAFRGALVVCYNQPMRLNDGYLAR